MKNIANPVSLARKVMQETPHCLLVGDGAMKFAKKINFPILSDPLELVTNDSVCKSFVIAQGMYKLLLTSINYCLLACNQ